MDGFWGFCGSSALGFVVTDSGLGSHPAISVGSGEQNHSNNNSSKRLSRWQLYKTTMWLTRKLMYNFRKSVRTAEQLLMPRRYHANINQKWAKTLMPSMLEGLTLIENWASSQPPLHLSRHFLSIIEKASSGNLTICALIWWFGPVCYCCLHTSFRGKVTMDKILTNQTLRILFWRAFDWSCLW